VEHPQGWLVDEVSCSCGFVCRSNCLSVLLKAQPLVASACISALLSSLLLYLLLMYFCALPSSSLIKYWGRLPLANDLLESFLLNAYPLCDLLVLLRCGGKKRKYGLLCFERDSLMVCKVVCVDTELSAGARAGSFGG